MIKKLILFSYILAASHSVEGAWLDRKAEGWAWYEDKEEKEAKKPPTKPVETKSAKEQLDTEKKALEEKLAKAMIEPTEDNVRDYMIAQKRWTDQASLLSNIWQTVLLSNPELDPTATIPITQYGIQINKEIQRDERKNFVKSLSKDYGIFFFYEGNSKLSQALSNVVKIFSERYDWKVVAISVDGAIIDGFQSTKLDNGISKTLGVQIFPAIFIVNPKDSSATPVGYGMISVDKLEENIQKQFRPHYQGLTHD
jgi:conjugal transfer pilus assembly protein TraF